MTEANISKKRKRNRKARTEVPSSSSSDSESPISPTKHNRNSDETNHQPGQSLIPVEEDEQQLSSSPQDQVVVRPQNDAQKSQPSPSPASEERDSQDRKPLDPEEAFNQFYLSQATKEFANDLDKLRGASDFNEKSSVAILIEALKQGRACLTNEERRGIGENGISS